MDKDYLQKLFINEAKPALNRHGSSDSSAAYENGYQIGFIDGEKSEHDHFWDIYQNSGQREDYMYAFAGPGWTDETFIPKYDIAPRLCSYMFASTGITDLRNLPVSISFDTVTGIMTSFLYYASIKYIGIIDVHNAESIDGILNRADSLVYVEKLIFKSTAEQNAGSTTFRCRSLIDIVFEGNVDSSVNISYSPLSIDSMKSFISCLKNYKGTADDLKYEVKFSDTCWTNLEASGPSPAGGTWKEYVSSLGWLY